MMSDEVKAGDSMGRNIVESNRKGLERLSETELEHVVKLCDASCTMGKAIIFDRMEALGFDPAPFMDDDLKRLQADTEAE